MTAGRAAAIAAALAMLLCGSAARAGDPQLDWRTLETPHFYIHYYERAEGGGEADVAQALAHIAERAHLRLTPYLGHVPRGKTHVVLGDQTDDANGSATVLPYRQIALNAVSPDDRSYLNDYDDWLTELFTHEYTHIVHLDTIGGLCASLVNIVLGWGIGTVYAPNQAQPRWFIEGLAVLEETRRTSGGRLRSSIWDMYLRAATLEGRFERLDQFSNDPIQFPQGNSAYLYGSSFLAYVADAYGERAIRDLSHDYGSVCIPGALNRAARRVLGKTWVELYREYRDRLRARYGAQRDSLARAGLTPLTVRSAFAPDVGRAAYTDEGRSLLYLESEGHRRQRLVRLDLASGRQTTELRTDAAGGLALSPDGRFAVYHKAIPYRTYYSWSDIMLFDRQSGEERRLTEGTRAQNPTISPDAQRVVFEINGVTSRGLGMVSTDGGGQVEVLLPATGLEQAYTPTFSPDGKTIAFSWWRRGGTRDIWLMDLASRKLTRLTNDRAIDLEPRFSPDGKWLYFVSDRTAVFNLYAYELATGALFQASNVVNGVFDPAISPDGKQAALVGFVADGYVLQTAPIDRAAFRPAVTPLLDRPDVDVVPPSPSPRYPSRRYSLFPTIFPFVFTPFSNSDAYGQTIGLSLNGNDVVGNHGWSLRLGFNTGRADDLTFAANYSYVRLWPSFSAGVGHSLERRGGLVVNGVDAGHDEDIWTAGLGIGLPLMRETVRAVDLGVNYNFSYARPLGNVPPIDPSAPSLVLPAAGRTAGIGVRLSYSDVRRYLYSVSAQEGRYIALNLGIASPLLGSDYGYYSLSWNWLEFFPMPWRPRYLRDHVLYLGYSGGISTGDARRRGLFYLGGYPTQNLLTSLYDFSRPGNASLRGYAYGSLSGDQFEALTAEYRFPIVWIEHGYETLPLYFKRLHGAVFADVGNAFFGPFAVDKLNVGVGGELRLELTYAYYIAASLQLGYARGLMAGGTDQVYFLLNNPF